MRLHADAKLSVKGRGLLIDRVEIAGWSLTRGAEAAGVSDRSARKWLARYRAEGADGLFDRFSALATVANRTQERRVEAIAALRRLRMTGAEIADVLSMAHSMVSGIVAKIGMGKLGRLGLEPAQRYERECPGELIHIDVKKLGRSPTAPGIASPASVAAMPASAPTLRGASGRSSAGSSCASRSTTRRAWPTSRSSTTKGRSPRSRSASRGRALLKLRHDGAAADHR